MTIRVAAIEVSHWHSLFDAAYLRHLVAMPDVDLVAIQDPTPLLSRDDAAEVEPAHVHRLPKDASHEPPRLRHGTRRHRQMAGIANDLLDEGFPSSWRNQWGLARPRWMRWPPKRPGWMRSPPSRWPSATHRSPSAHVNCSPRGALARYRTSTFGLTDRVQHATKPGIAPGCSIPPRPAAASDLGPHGLDMFLYLTGEEARLRAQLGRRAHERPVEDYASGDAPLRERHS